MYCTGDPNIERYLFKTIFIESSESLKARTNTMHLIPTVGNQLMHLSPPPNLFRLLSILRQWFCCCVDSWFIVAPFVVVLCLFHVLLGNNLCPLSFCSNLSGDERAGCLTLFIFMVSYDLLFCGSSLLYRRLVCSV